MAWVMVAGAVVSVAGAAISADSSRKAGNKQAAAGDAALAEQARQFDENLAWQKEIGMATMGGEQAMYDQQRQDQLDQKAQSRADFGTARDQVVGDYAPTVQYGQNAQNQLQYAMGLGGSGNGEAGALSRDFTAADFNKDPGYDFRMQEGQTGVNNKFAASGSLLSGAALKALTKYNQDYASNEYGAAYGRFKTNQGDQYNRLTGMVNTGQNALAQTSNASMSAASGMSGAGIASTNAMQQAGTAAQNGISQAYSTMGAAGTAARNDYTNAFTQNAYNQGNIAAQQQMAYGKAFNQGLEGLQKGWNSYQSGQNNNNVWANSGDYWTKNGTTYGNSGGYSSPEF